jgi:ATP-dependent Zn protease
MNIRNNNLIAVFSFLALFIGSFLVTAPVHAQYNGVYYFGAPIPYIPRSANQDSTYNNYPNNQTQYTSNNNTTTQPVIKNYYYYNTPANTSGNTNTSKNTNTTTTTTTDNNTTQASNDINQNYGSLAANALVGSSGSFMPSGLLQWIFLAIIVAVMIVLWRYIHRSEEKYMAEPLKHA